MPGLQKNRALGSPGNAGHRCLAVWRALTVACLLPAAPHEAWLDADQSRRAGVKPAGQ